MAAAAAPVGYAFPELGGVEITLLIFAQLPADQLLLSARVSRAWRATVLLPVLWWRVDLSAAAGLAWRPRASAEHSRYL